jgi:MFS family permease
MTIYTCHSVDRSIISVLIEPIKREFHVSDKILGSVSLAYSLAFILAILPVGSLIDRVRRVRLLALLLGIWSLMTAVASLATNMTQLIAARMAVGAAEAGGQPISVSLISDIFPQHRRASALGVFYLATGFGAICAYLGGAFVAAGHGWRSALLIGGVPGLMLVPILLLTLREPQRGAMDPYRGGADAGVPAPKMGAVARFIVASPAIRQTLLAMLFSSFVMGSFIAWIPAFLMREEGFQIRMAGMIAAFAGGFVPALGAVIWGIAADRLARVHSARVGVMAAVSISVMAFAGVGFTMTSDPRATIACVILFGVFAGGWMAPSLALLIGLTPPRMRGSVMAFGQISTALGSGIGPFVVGALSDLFHSLAPALGIGAAVGLLALFHYLRAIRAAMRDDAML